MACLIKPDMHHTFLCIRTCLCDGCLPCCMLLSGLLLSLASVSFRSCEDSFDYVRLSSLLFFLSGSQARWPLPSVSLLSLLASCFVLSLCCATYHLFYHASQISMSASNFFTLPSKPLLGYVTALLSPSYSVVSCRWSWRLLHDGQDYVGISKYLLYY